MSGRRLRGTISKTVSSQEGGVEKPIVVVAGLSNTYTHYITTFEEYQRQRYEAASTIYGPHTLQAYQQQYSFLAENLVQEKQIEDEGPHPPNLHDEQISFVPDVIYDHAPAGHNFGDCILQVRIKFTFMHAFINCFIENYIVFFQFNSTTRAKIVNATT